MHYVKVENGRISEGPLELSGSPTAVPSAHWSQEQMKINNYRFVDLTHDPASEEIDYLNPVIGEFTVTYPRKPKPEAAALLYAKQSKTREVKGLFHDHLQRRHSVQDQVTALLALGADSVKIRADIKAFHDVYIDAVLRVNAAKTKQEIEDVEPRWPDT